MKYIEAKAKNKTALILVDEDDFEFIKSFSWFADKKGRSQMNYDYNTVKMHHLIMGFPIGDMEIDHIDCNKSNNCKNNLRIVTKSQNAWNKKISRNNVSGYKCIHFHTPSNRWRVIIGKNNKKHYIGQYTDIEDARIAYLNAVSELHGKFARTE